MNFPNDRPCGCEPCPIDLDNFKFETGWEDPFFVGKSCLWHKHIEGTKGFICPDILNGEPAIFVEYNGETFTVPVDQLKKWARKIGAKRK